jgi:hypothetical protein
MLRGCPNRFDRPQKVSTKNLIFDRKATKKITPTEGSETSAKSGKIPLGMFLILLTVNVWMAVRIFTMSAVFFN